ncbi:MAG: ferredoxin:glutaredoxin reductase [Chloroflexi bacterium]|nr:ferredoxin:glutaredoxin reductase [Chloroflexota bacterium]
MSELKEAEISEEEIQQLYEKLNREAEESGYHLNPDTDQTKFLIRGILINQKRYGYWNCPCRLSSGIKEEDIDIICPCDYRDPDLEEFGACYCSLYVSDEVFEGRKKVRSIPERRGQEKKKEHEKVNLSPGAALGLAYPVYRCKVCGYLTARDQPPGVCPICKAKKDRFERFL